VSISIEKIITLAKREAEKSTSRYRLGALIYRKKEIISTGYNKILTNCPKIPEKYKKYPTSVHAEMAAIVNARANLAGTTLVVVRINRCGKLMHSFPCKHCFPYIVLLGIKRIIYINANGKVAQLKLST